MAAEVSSVLVLDEGFFDPRKPWFIRWGDLPHWRQDGATYFVTFRLSDSLPQEKLRGWRRELEEWRRANPDPAREELEGYTLQRRRRVEKWLDRGLGSCLLLDLKAKEIVSAAIRYFEGTRYELGDFAVAANHVHAVLRTALGEDLSHVLHSWKRHTSALLMKASGGHEVCLHGGGHLWQTESFDHIVRNRESLERITAYIRKHDDQGAREPPGRT